MKKNLRLHLDEAWRGPLAGPVSVWCTLALWSFKRSNFVDSKSIPERKRERLYSELVALEKAWKVSVWSGFASNAMIDTDGIMSALQYASIQAIFTTLKKYFLRYWQPQLSLSVQSEDIVAIQELARLFRKRKITPEVIASIIKIPNSIAKVKTIIIDWNHTFWLDTALDISVTTIIKWDATHPMISMASIIAKVERDEWMKKSAKKFSKYWFEQHKWYGTKLHRENIATYWLSPLHRASFCKNIKIKEAL